MSIQERKIIMLNEKMSKEEQEFIQLYRNADAATRYAIECGLTLFKGKYDREELMAYCRERIGEYNAYSKAIDAVNNEYVMAGWYIDQAIAIAKAAFEYDDTVKNGVNTLKALFGAIETALKSANEMLSKGGDRILEIKQRKIDEVGK